VRVVDPLNLWCVCVVMLEARGSEHTPLGREQTKKRHTLYKSLQYIIDSDSPLEEEKKQKKTAQANQSPSDDIYCKRTHLSTLNQESCPTFSGLSPQFLPRKAMGTRKKGEMVIFAHAQITKST